MFLLLLSILFCTLINADDSNEEKYIDLLPEEEKQVFLERVARSLISGEKTKDSKYKSSEELPIKELNQYGQFVRPVLKEESSNLRRDTDDDKEKPESREILKVRGVNDQKFVSDVEDKNVVDLTLRQGRRSKRHKDGNNDYETIPVKTVYDVDDLKVKETESKYLPLDVVNKNMVSSEKSVEKSSNEVDIQVRGPKRQSRKPYVDLNARRTMASNEATIINDFDPDEVTESNVDNNQGIAEEEENRSKSSETKTSNVVFNQNGFTQAIYEPHEGSEYFKSSKESPEEISETASATVNSLDSVTTPIITSLTTKRTTNQTNKLLIDIPTATTNIKNTTMNILVDSSDSKQHLRVKSDEGPEVDLNLLSEKSYLKKNDSEKYIIGVNDLAYNSTENNSSSDKTYYLNNDTRNRLSDDKNLDKKVENIDSTYSEVNQQFVENNNNVAENSSSENISSNNRKEKKYVEREDVTNSTDTDNFKLTTKRKETFRQPSSSDHKYGDQSATVPVEEIDIDLDSKSKTFANKSLEIKSVINSTEGNNTQEPIEQEANSLELDNINKKVNSHVRESNFNSYSDNKAGNVLKDVVASKSKYKMNVTKSNTSISQEGSNNLQNEEVHQGVKEHVSRSSLRLSKDNDDENRNNAENSMTSTNKQDLISDEKKEQDKVKEVFDSYKSNIKQNVPESESNETLYDTNNLQNIKKNISTTTINEYVNLDISNNSNLVNYSAVIKNQTNKNTLRSKNFNEFVLTTTENSYMEKPYFDVSKHQPYSSQHTASDERDDPYHSKEKIKLDKYHAQAAINSNENESKSYKKNGENYLKTNFTDVSYVSQSLNFEKIIYQLKEELGSLNKDDMKTHKENDLPTDKNLKKYSVYELPAGETPFIKQKPKVNHNEEFLNQEQPNYVPVYNYSPNNAYYNAYNRLGPNDEENQENENVRVENGKYEDVTSKENLDSSSELYLNSDLKSEHEALRKFKFSGKRQTYSPFKSRTRTKNSNVPLPIVINEPKFTEIYFNPDEYLDMDYYFGRSNSNSRSRPRNKRKKHCKSTVSPFPKSEELDHPYNLLDNGNVKNHLSAVRQVLYKQHRFGFVPEITAPSEENLKPIENNPSVDDQEHFEYLRSKNRNEFIVLLPNELINNINDGETPENVRRLDSSHRFRKHQNGKQKDKEKWKRNAGSIRNIISISDSKDVFLHLNQLQKLNLSYVRRNNEYKDVDVYASVLKDMIEADSKALKQYDWLGSTIDIRSALDKLSKLTYQRKNEEAIHLADLQLLNYVVYIYKSAKNSLKETDDVSLRKKSNHLLPKNRNRKKEYLKTKGLINRVWLYIRGRLKATISEGDVDELEDFGNFLYDLDNNLFDLHDALKHIAMVTNYKKQRFYENLKEVYLKNPQNKCLLEALLHVFTARFLGLVEDSALNGVEDGYFNYIENNIAVVERSEKEMVFILKLMNEIRDLNK